MATSRKRVVLSMKDKAEILKSLANGKCASDLAKEYGVGKSTISDIKKKKQEITRFIDHLDSTDGSDHRKTMKMADNRQLDDALYKWFLQKRSQGEIISGPILCEKALQFNDMLENKNPNFKATSGWLHRFKSRHGIRELDIQGEKLSADNVAAENFLKEFEELLNENDYSADNVYNADETGLNWRALPRKSLVAKKESSAPGVKVSKDRVTLLVCANATGSHRLPLLLIGKSKKPRCFKNFNMNLLPCVYKSQRNAWMDCEIFSEWYVNTFLPSVKGHQMKSGKREKTLLVIDNAPSHPSCELLNGKDKYTTVIFLPPNVTSLLQPMDQGVIETLKRRYRKEFLRRVLLNDDDDAISENMKKIDVKECAFMVGEAWSSVSEVTLLRCWNKLYPKPVEEMDSDFESQIQEELLGLLKELPGCNDCNSNDVDDWLTVDSADPGHQILQDNEIISSVMQENDADPSTDSEDEGTNVQIPTHSEAFNGLEVALKWFGAQEESDIAQIAVLRRIRDLAARKRFTQCKQKKISDFFL